MLELFSRTSQLTVAGMQVTISAPEHASGMASDVDGFRLSKGEGGGEVAKVLVRSRKRNEAVERNIAVSV